MAVSAAVVNFNLLLCKTTSDQGEILLYQTKDGGMRVEVRMVDETVWLTQDQMAELYGKSKSTINEPVKNFYEAHELSEEATLRKFGNSEFSIKPTNLWTF